MIVDIIKRTAVIDVRTGPRGRAGTNGTDGQGVPTGGTTGQILAKNSGTNYDTRWIDLNLTWEGISGKPSTFPPSTHNQAWSTITGTPTTLAGYGIADGITAAAAAAAYAPISHTQAIGTITGLQAALDGKAASSHNQAWSTITGTPTTLSGYGITNSLTAAEAAETYAPLNHDQAISTITGLQAALDDKVETSLIDEDVTPETIPVRDTSGALRSQAYTASNQTAGHVTTLHPASIQIEQLSNAFVATIAPPDELPGNLLIKWPAVGGDLLTSSSNLPAANLTGTINTARLPATITGLTSVTSTTFVGALTGTASGNLALTGGTITGALTLPNAIFSGLSLTSAQATNTIDVSTTWNTTGNPSLIYGRAINTASGASANLIDLGTVAGGSLFKVTKAGVFSLGNNFNIQTYGVADSLTFGLQGNSTLAIYGSATTTSRQLRMTGGSYFGWATGSPDGALDLILNRAAAASLQLGVNHATTATNQTIKAHNVTTGTGPNLILSGGTGSVANGVVIISRLPTSNPGPGILWNNAGTPAIGT